MADVAGTYTISLTVNDGSLDSEADIVLVATENSPPVANAGPDLNAFTGDLVSLDGSASSDVDGDLLSFSWSLITVPDGSASALSNADQVVATFIPDLPGIYVGQLIVKGQFKTCVIYKPIDVVGLHAVAVLVDRQVQP